MQTPAVIMEEHQRCLLYNLLKQKQTEQTGRNPTTLQAPSIVKENTPESQFGESFGKGGLSADGDLQLANQFREVVRGIIKDRYKEQNTELAELEK